MHSVLKSSLFVGAAFSLAVAVLTTSLAAAAEQPAPAARAADFMTPDAVSTAVQISKRLIDAPIVRSSKGCLATLGEGPDGQITVRSVKDEKGRPVCVKDLPYLDHHVTSRQ